MQTIAETCVRFDAAHLSVNFSFGDRCTHVSYLIINRAWGVEVTLEDSLSLRVPAQMPHLRLKSVRYIMQERIQSRYTCIYMHVIYLHCTDYQYI